MARRSMPLPIVLGNQLSVCQLHLSSASAPKCKDDQESFAGQYEDKEGSSDGLEAKFLTRFLRVLQDASFIPSRRF